MDKPTHVRATENSLSPEILANTPPVPSQQEAAVLSSLIDRARAAMGWGRLPEREHDVAIIAWFEILSDSGVPVRHWGSCYRSAQARKSETMAQGAEARIVTPNDLAVEWGKVRKMNADIDRSRLLPENAAAACQRCFGTGKEEMPDGSVRESCLHSPLSEGEVRERAEAKARQIEFMREAVKKIGAPKPPPKVVEIKPKGRWFVCDSCGRKVNTIFGSWELGDECRELLNRGDHQGELKFCTGRMTERK